MPQTVFESTVEVCDALGRRNLAIRLGRTPAAVSNAVREGVFPPGWYLVIQGMCEEVGAECPKRLFAFLSPPDAAAPTSQDAA